MSSIFYPKTLSCRARVRSGLRIVSATSVSDHWYVTIQKENPKHVVTHVIAYRKDLDPEASNGDADFNRTDEPNEDVEVFVFLFESTTDFKTTNESGRITVSISVISHAVKSSTTNNSSGPATDDASASAPPKSVLDEALLNASLSAHTKESRKHDFQVTFRKDEIEAVLPIAKNWDLMNTAVLTGRQVSQVMKVFIVSQAGKVADVTLQSSCTALDESVIKASSSCSSVYVDGSELRGSSNASIRVRYGEFEGVAKFCVWMPEFPLEVAVADFRLSQIKGWKTPDEQQHGG